MMDFPIIIIIIITILLYSNIFYDAWNTFGIRKIFGDCRLSQFGIEEKYNFIGLVIQNIKSA